MSLLQKGSVVEQRASEACRCTGAPRQAAGVICAYLDCLKAAIPSPLSVSKQQASSKSSETEAKWKV